MEQLNIKRTNASQTMHKHASILVNLCLYECYTGHEVLEDILVFSVVQANLQPVECLLLKVPYRL